MEADIDQRLEIFLGTTSDAMCHVYARLRGPEAAQGLTLSGRLTGPACIYAQTLPATFAWRDCGAGESLLARAVVPEPCYWTPEMPHVYEGQLELRDGEQVVAETRRLLGIRNLGAGGRDLIYAATRWVLRAVRADRVPPTALESWRLADAAMLVQGPDDALCESASRIGVLLVAELEQPNLAEIRRLARWPAVGIVVLPRGAMVDLGGLAHNLVLAERISAADWHTPQPWADLVLVELRDPIEMTAKIANCGLPLVVERAESNPGSVEEARARCDRLQRDLANPELTSGGGQFAGYVA